MDRLNVLKTLMNQKGLKNYLEIGVSNGHIFFRIQSGFKMAVDPGFAFDKLRKAGKLLLNRFNFFNQYFPKTSDEFFAQDAPGLFTQKKIELALIDGMHEYAFALRDVENTLQYSSDDIVIILHDCNPLKKNASCSFNEWKSRNFEGNWNGDVWKAILHLRSMRKDLTCFVLDTDHGLGVVVKKKNDQPLSFTKEEISRLTYEDLEGHREEWLGLKPASWFYEYFGLQV